MRTIILAATLIAISGCSRPQEVRSLAKSALPIAANLKVSSATLQARFGQHRSTLEGRAAVLSAEIARAKGYSSQVEKDWRFARDTARPQQLVILREDDAALLADPLASLVGPTTNVSKPPPWDIGAINSLVTGFDELEKERKPDPRELLALAKSVNDELSKLKKEEPGAAATAAP